MMMDANFVRMKSDSGERRPVARTSSQKTYNEKKKAQVTSKLETLENTPPGL